MLTLFQIIVVFMLLLMLSFVAPKLQPIMYTSIFFFFLLYLLTTLIFPFGKNYVQLFSSIPGTYAKLLIGSAILFYISELVSQHIEEAGYGSLASMSHFAVKIAILTLWIDQTTAVIDILSSLISK